MNCQHEICAAAVGHKPEDQRLSPLHGWGQWDTRGLPAQTFTLFESSDHLSVILWFWCFLKIPGNQPGCFHVTMDSKRCRWAGTLASLQLITPPTHWSYQPAGQIHAGFCLFMVDQLNFGLHFDASKVPSLLNLKKYIYHLWKDTFVCVWTNNIYTDIPCTQKCESAVHTELRMILINCCKIE